MIGVLLRDKRMLSILQEAITRKPQGTSLLSSSTPTHSGTAGGRFYFPGFLQLQWILNQALNTQTYPAVRKESQSQPLHHRVKLLQVPASRLKSLSFPHSWSTESITVNSQLLCSLGSSSDELLFNLLSALTKLRCEKGRVLCRLHRGHQTMVAAADLLTGLWQRHEWHDLYLMGLQHNPDASVPQCTGKSRGIINTLTQHLTLSRFCVITAVFFLGWFFFFSVFVCGVLFLLFCWIFFFLFWCTVRKNIWNTISLF